MLSFNPSVPAIQEEEVLFKMHMDDGIDDSENVSFHIMWKPKDTWTSGNYIWKFEYLIKTEDGNPPSGYNPVKDNEGIFSRLFKGRNNRYG